MSNTNSSNNNGHIIPMDLDNQPSKGFIKKISVNTIRFAGDKIEVK